jgi:hypothetical protein
MFQGDRLGAVVLFRLPCNDQLSPVECAAWSTCHDQGCCIQSPQIMPQPRHRGRWRIGIATGPLTILLPARVLLKPRKPCNEKSLCEIASVPH